MKLVTVATASEGYFPWLRMSCTRHGATLDVLGWQQKWQGFSWRFQLMEQYLQEQDPNTLVCFIDGYDVLVLKTPQEIEQSYHELVVKHGKRVIIGTEIQHNLFYWIMGFILFGTVQDKHLLNAGVYMGPAKDLLIMIQYIHKNISQDPKSDDQYSMIQYYLKNPENIYLDTRHELILNIVDPYPYSSELKSPHLVIKNKQLFWDGHRPAFLHANANTPMDNVIEDLEYPITAEDKKKNKDYHRHTIIKKTPYYLKKLLPILGGLLLLILVVIWWFLYR